MNGTQLFRLELVEQIIKATHPLPLSPSYKPSLQRGVLPQKLNLASPLSRGDGAEAPGVCTCMNGTQSLRLELVEQIIKATRPPVPLSIAKPSPQRGVLPQELSLNSPLLRGDDAKRQGCVLV